MSACLRSFVPILTASYIRYLHSPQAEGARLEVRTRRRTRAPRSTGVVARLGDRLSPPDCIEACANLMFLALSSLIESITYGGSRAQSAKETSIPHERLIWFGAEVRRESTRLPVRVRHCSGQSVRRQGESRPILTGAVAQACLGCSPF